MQGSHCTGGLLFLSKLEQSVRRQTSSRVNGTALQVAPLCQRSGRKEHQPLNDHLRKNYLASDSTAKTSQEQQDAGMENQGGLEQPSSANGKGMPVEAYDYFNRRAGAAAWLCRQMLGVSIYA